MRLNIALAYVFGLFRTFGDSARFRVRSVRTIGMRWQLLMLAAPLKSAEKLANCSLSPKARESPETYAKTSTGCPSEPKPPPGGTSYILPLGKVRTSAIWRLRWRQTLY